MRAATPAALIDALRQTSDSARKLTVGVPAVVEARLLVALRVAVAAERVCSTADGSCWPCLAPGVPPRLHTVPSPRV
jgi:hypothetical protein